MNIAPDYQTPERMEKKLRAIPMPDLTGKSVIDIGCDMRFWCDLAKQRGASEVVGVDRGRDVRGNPINMADYKMDIGKQWHQVGRFDVAFMFSMYHHAYQSAGGDHKAVFWWVWNQIKPDGLLIWENPVDTRDVVANRNISPEYHDNYNMTAILDAACELFEPEFIGPAEHEPHRLVFYFHPRSKPAIGKDVKVVNGAGGASKAFAYADNRRSREIEHVLGFKPFPGSLNVVGDSSINWWSRYYRAEILDLKDRSTGLDGEWGKRWARFYPVTFNREKAYVFRFEGDAYPLNFFELVSPIRLRDKLEENNRLCQ
jgi:hypothetical protein